MVSFRRVGVLLVAVALSSTAPFALAAGWGAKGVQEPDTRLDRVDGHMFVTPDQAKDGVRRVYFNGFQGQYAGYSVGYPTTFSPNVAALGTRHQTFPFQAWAMLGVWKDCNKDGYVGYGDQGLWEYNVRLLPADSPCPAQSLPSNPNKMTDWTFTPIHNDGAWVHEFLPIGYDDWSRTPAEVADGGGEASRNYDNNPWNFNDSDARVWGDWGKPGDSPSPKCAVNPQPRGTFHSVGNLTAYSDCYAGGRIEQSVGPAGGSTWTTVKAQQNPWGEEYDRSYVEPWDCTTDPVLTTQDPTYDGESGTTHQEIEHPEPGGDGRTWVNLSNSDYRGVGVSASGVGGAHAFGNTNLSNPRSSPGVDPGGSPAGTVNSTDAGLDRCERRTDGDYNDADYIYSTEGDVANAGAKKTQADQTLFYIEGRHTGAPWAITGRGAPTDLGVRLTGREGCNFEGSCNQGFWVGNTVTAASRNPLVDRDALTAMPVTYITYYARVGTEAIQKWGLSLPGAGGSYGAEACVQPGTLWSCVPNEWWPDGTMPRTGSGVRFDPDSLLRGLPVGARVFDSYNLRDVDCFDESVGPLRDQGLSYGTVTGTSCDV